MNNTKEIFNKKAVWAEDKTDMGGDYGFIIDGFNSDYFNPSTRAITLTHDFLEHPTGESDSNVSDEIRALGFGLHRWNMIDYNLERGFVADISSTLNNYSVLIELEDFNITDISWNNDFIYEYDQLIEIIENNKEFAGYFKEHDYYNGEDDTELILLSDLIKSDYFKYYLQKGYLECLDLFKDNYWLLFSNVYYTLKNLFKENNNYFNCEYQPIIELVIYEDLTFNLKLFVTEYELPENKEEFTDEDGNLSDDYYDQEHIENLKEVWSNN